MLLQRMKHSVCVCSDDLNSSFEEKQRLEQTKRDLEKQLEIANQIISSLSTEKATVTTTRYYVNYVININL